MDEEHRRVGEKQGQKDGDKEKPKNPLVSKVDMHQELAQAEADNVGAATETSLDKHVSPSILILCGLDLEAEQHALSVKATRIWNYLQDWQHTKLQLQCNALQWKILAWSNIQQLYVPGIITLCRVKEHVAMA
ncbi:hypothetical protein C0995_010776 [Termitomyces sp. Mi166|nr:hypothetical protein C0995_010776 [Termitomyces sp. Mi166\